MRPKSFGNWLKSGSKLTPLWRRDPGLNLSGALCKNPQLGNSGGCVEAISDPPFFEQPLSACLGAEDTVVGFPEHLARRPECAN
jgi:hypothetical protein